MIFMVINMTMDNHHVFFMGKLIISMAIFNCKLFVYQRVFDIAIQ